MNLTFELYDQQHPEIWIAFERITIQEIARLERSGLDRKKWRLGAKSIYEKIRDHVPMNYKGRSFKLSNNYTPDYARKFMQTHPEFKGLFKIRNRITDNKKPNKKEETKKPIIFEGGQLGMFETRKRIGEL